MKVSKLIFAILGMAILAYSQQDTSQTVDSAPEISQQTGQMDDGSRFDEFSRKMDILNRQQRDLNRQINELKDSLSSQKENQESSMGAGEKSVSGSENIIIEPSGDGLIIRTEQEREEDFVVEWQFYDDGKSEMRYEKGGNGEDIFSSKTGIEFGNLKDRTERYVRLSIINATSSGGEEALLSMSAVYGYGKKHFVSLTYGTDFGFSMSAGKIRVGYEGLVIKSLVCLGLGVDLGYTWIDDDGAIISPKISLSYIKGGMRFGIEDVVSFTPDFINEIAYFVEFTL